VKFDDYLHGKADQPSIDRNDEKTVADLAMKIHKLIDAEPKYYQEIAEYFGDYDFQVVAQALGKLHAEEQLWQDAPNAPACALKVLR
jgi:2,5-furandicarboxylate decarboxylase 1